MGVCADSTYRQSEKNSNLNISEMYRAEKLLAQSAIKTEFFVKSRQKGRENESYILKNVFTRT